MLSLPTFLTYAVYALRVGNELPVQSDFVPSITIYYTASIILTFISMLWFYYFNKIQASERIPFFLHKVVKWIRKCWAKITRSETSLLKKREIIENAFEIVTAKPTTEMAKKSLSGKKISNKVKPQEENELKVNQIEIVTADPKIEEKIIKTELDIDLKVLNGFIQIVFSTTMIICILVILFNH